MTEQNNDTSTVAETAPPVPQGAPAGAETRQQYLNDTHVFEGRHYGPGLVDVPQSFPQPKGAQRQMTDDATALAYFQQHRDEFEAFRAQREAGAQNDAGLAQPMSGESGVLGTEAGSNQGAQTGVDAQNAPDGAAGQQEGDRLNAATPATGAAGTRTQVGTSGARGGRAPGQASASGADRP